MLFLMFFLNDYLSIKIEGYSFSIQMYYVTNYYVQSDSQMLSVVCDNEIIKFLIYTVIFANRAN